MKIALLSGALKNAGDYLITKRCKEILEYGFDQPDIKTYIRNKPLGSDEVTEINQADCIVIGGGPCYKKDLYPQSLPLVGDLKDLTPRIFMLGCGWYGGTTSSKDVWSYKFSDTSRVLLNRVEKDSGVFGCRDYYAVKVLKGNGYDKSLMTGCPAWYDLEKIQKRLPDCKEIREIAVSDPADIRHYGDQSLELCKYLVTRFPDAGFHYFFHRGTKSDQYTSQNVVSMIEKITKQLKELGFQVHDISYGVEGFSLYDTCDLHIGHRVHAHIYNLSQRRRSILIEEDSRGAGVNEPLGLWGIKAYDKKRKARADIVSRAYGSVIDGITVNPYVVNDVAALLDYCEQDGYSIFNQAFSQMEFYFDNMKKYTDHMRSILEG